MVGVIVEVTIMVTLVIFLIAIVVLSTNFLLSKVSVKMLNGSEHIGASSFSIFLGAKSEDLTRWGICRAGSGKVREQRKGKHWRCTKKTFTEVPGLSGPLSPPSFLSSPLSPCTRSSRPGDENRGNQSRIWCLQMGRNDYVFQNLFPTGHMSTGFWAQTQHPGWKARQTEWDRFLNILSRLPVLSPTFSQYCRQLDLSRNDIFWICGRCNDGRPLHLHHLLLDPGSGDFVILITIICRFDHVLHVIY